MITNRLYHNPDGYKDLKKDNGKMTKTKVASRLGWIKDNLAWLGLEGTREQIEMLIADILRDKKGDSNG